MVNFQLYVFFIQITIILNIYYIINYIILKSLLRSPQVSQTHVWRKERTIYSCKRHAFCDAVLSYERKPFLFRNNSDRESKLKWQKSPKTTTDTQDENKFY